MSSTSSNSRILIAGAGLGGLVLAQCLRAKGIPFEIFDRDEDVAQRQGWAIGVHSIIDDMKSSFCSDMPPLETADHLRPLKLEAQVAFYEDGSKMAVTNSPETPCMRLNRLRFRKWLSTNIPVQWNKKIIRVEEDANGVKLYFRDGTHASGDVLIGADGVHSIVREHVLGRANNDVLRINPISSIWGDFKLSGESLERQLSLGHSAWATTSGIYQFFVGISKVNDDLSADYYWYLSWPDENVGKEEHWLHNATKADKYEYARKAVDALEPRFKEVFDSMPVDGILDGTWIFREAEILPFPVRRAVLLGDAAHAMTPFRGEGGMHAIRDAFNISKVFDQVNWLYDQPKLAACQEEVLERGGKAVVSSRNAFGPLHDRSVKKMAWGHEVKPSPEVKVLLKDCTP